MQAFERSYATMNNPGSVLGITRAVADTPPALGSGHAYVAANPEQWVGRPSVGTGECVPLVQQATGAPLTSQWRRGALVKGNISIRPGTAIATFDGDGHYGNQRWSGLLGHRFGFYKWIVPPFPSPGKRPGRVNAGRAVGRPE
ncbi:MAG: BPSL0067 family protein [Acetobacteraceae bacterium]|nr:BPSL0067 family protein [Acetobacteraceae bacterium]